MAYTSKIHYTPHHAGAAIDINSATIEQLISLGLTVVQAEAIFSARPVEDWSEVARLPGLDSHTIARLQAGRAEIRTL